jgi:hypothetical protein
LAKSKKSFGVLGKSSAIEIPHILQIACRADAREREGGRAKHTPEGGGMSPI